jgi:N-acetylglucosaminyldiphosphoundecaprenol N-acetyl-beta-D-mannosaminyltransferase
VKIDILGVQIDNLDITDLLANVEKFLMDGKQHYIVTPNPEIVIAAQKDKEFLKILNEADISLPDGVGLVWASYYLNKPLKQRITGVDFMLKICEMAEQKNCSIFLLGAKGDVAQKTAEVLMKKFPKLKIVGTESGGEIKLEKLSILNSSLIEKINNAKPDILFVAFGAPKQEKWIYYYLPSLPSIKLAMGVGGAFDFISGKVKRAPRFLQKIGLEWFWRFLLEPWRWKRILTATIKFSWKVLSQ